MIATFLVEHSALVPVAFLLIAAVCTSVGAVCLGVGHRLPRARRHGPRILRVLAVLTVLPVAALTLVPTGDRTLATCTVQFSVPTLGTVETLANVALFFPPVYFAALATQRPLLLLTTGTATSAAIETLQAVVPAIGRTCDTNDWLMNTIGTTLAALLATATIALTNRTATKQPTKPPATPDRPNPT